MYGSFQCFSGLIQYASVLLTCSGLPQRPGQQCRQHPTPHAGCCQGTAAPPWWGHTLLGGVGRSGGHGDSHTETLPASPPGGHAHIRMTNEVLSLMRLHWNGQNPMLCRTSWAMFRFSHGIGEMQGHTAAGTGCCRVTGSHMRLRGTWRQFSAKTQESVAFSCTQVQCKAN